MTKQKMSSESVRPKKAEPERSGKAAPTTRQYATYMLAKACLVELEALYMDVLEEKRHNWAAHPERQEWLQAEVVRLRAQRKALEPCSYELAMQIVREYREMNNGTLFVDSSGSG